MSNAEKVMRLMEAEINSLRSQNAELRERVEKQEGYLKAKDETINSMGRANGRMDDTIFELRERVEALQVLPRAICDLRLNGKSDFGKLIEIFQLVGAVLYPQAEPAKPESQEEE